MRSAWPMARRRSPREGAARARRARQRTSRRRACERRSAPRLRVGLRERALEGRGLRRRVPRARSSPATACARTSAPGARRARAERTQRRFGARSSTKRANGGIRRARPTCRSTRPCDRRTTGASACSLDSELLKTLETSRYDLWTSGAELVDAVYFDAEPGAVVGPFPHRYGYALVRVVSRTPPQRARSILQIHGSATQSRSTSSTTRSARSRGPRSTPRARNRRELPATRRSEPRARC